MDLIILVIMIGLIIFFYKKFRNVIYFLGIVEIFFRIVHVVGDLIGIKVINDAINSFIPESILSIFAKYSSGLLYDIIVWIFVVLFVIFEYYLIRGFFSKSK